MKQSASGAGCAGRASVAGLKIERLKRVEPDGALHRVGTTGRDARHEGSAETHAVRFPNTYAPNRPVVRSQYA